jgi:hypothetical protein
MTHALLSFLRSSLFKGLAGEEAKFEARRPEKITCHLIRSWGREAFHFSPPGPSSEREELRGQGPPEEQGRGLPAGPMSSMGAQASPSSFTEGPPPLKSFQSLPSSASGSWGSDPGLMSLIQEGLRFSGPFLSHG